MSPKPGRLSAIVKGLLKGGFMSLAEFKEGLAEMYHGERVGEVFLARHTKLECSRFVDRVF